MERVLAETENDSFPVLLMFFAPGGSWFLAILLIGVLLVIPLVMMSAGLGINALIGIAVKGASAAIRKRNAANAEEPAPTEVGTGSR